MFRLTLLTLLAALFLAEASKMQVKSASFYPICCSSCSKASVTLTPGLGNKVKNNLAKKLQSGISYGQFLTELYKLPQVYLTEIIDTINSTRTLVRQGEFSCGGYNSEGYSDAAINVETVENIAIGMLQVLQFAIDEGSATTQKIEVYMEMTQMMGQFHGEFISQVTFIQLARDFMVAVLSRNERRKVFQMAGELGLNDQSQKELDWWEQAYASHKSAVSAMGDLLDGYDDAECGEDGEMCGNMKRRYLTIGEVASYDDFLNDMQLYQMASASAQMVANLMGPVMYCIYAEQVDFFNLQPSCMNVCDTRC